MDERERLLAADLPGTDLLALDPASQSAQKLLAARILTGVNGDMHAHNISRSEDLVQGNFSARGD